MLALFAKLKLKTSIYPDAIHFLIGANLVLLFGRGAGAGVTTAWALWVELWFDPRYERSTTRPDASDLRDIAAYLAGAIAGVLVLTARHRLFALF